MSSILKVDTILDSNGNPFNGSLLGNVGKVLQVVTKTVNTMATYSSPVNSQTNIEPLNISFVKKAVGSKVIVTWMLNGELHQDNVIRIFKNGTLATNGMNTNNSSRWNGFVSAFYDQNEDSTPSNWFIQYIEENAASGTYQLYVGSSGGSSFTFSLNRTLNSSGGSDNNENMVSTVTLMEIAA